MTQALQTMSTLLLCTAAALFAVQWLVGFARTRRVAGRLVRAIPHPPLAQLDQRRSQASPEMVAAALRYVDPTAESSETALRSLGISGARRLALIGLGRLAIAAGVAVLVGGVLFHTRPEALLLYALIPFSFVFTLVCFSLSLKWASQGRVRRIQTELIFGLDLLVIFLESGLSLAQSLKSFAEVSARATPILKTPQRGLIVDIDNGIPYDRALNLWIERLGCPEARPIAALFMQSLTHGTELVPQLKQITSDMTEQRLFAARESIGIKAAQLTMLMVLFFLPSLLGLIAGPPVLSLLENFGTTP